MSKIRVIDRSYRTMSIEKTIKKEQKGSGGIIGISTSDGAVQRWILPSHIIARLMANFTESGNLATRKTFPNDLGKTRIKNDEKVVQHCCSIIKSWQNPFKHSETLSQIKAPPAFQKDLMNSETVGKSSFKNFIQNRIESNTFEFYEPIKKKKLGNFDAAIITMIMKVHGKDIATKNDRETFARLLVILRTSEIDINEVPRHELSSVLLALSNPDNASTLCKITKNELFKFLNISLGTISVIPMNTPKILGWDGSVSEITSYLTHDR